MAEMADAERVVRDYWQKVWVDADLDSLADVVVDLTIRHTIDGTHELTLEALRGRIADALRTMCGSEVIIDSITVDGDTVWARVTLKGTTLATMAPLTLTWHGPIPTRGRQDRGDVGTTSVGTRLERLIAS